MRVNTTFPSCVGKEYIRGDEKGDHMVTRDAYAAEIAQTRQERPDTRFACVGSVIVRRT
jgi:hypothetical protein